MSKTNDRGRPPRHIEGSHALAAWNVVCQNFPMLAELDIKMQGGDLTVFELQALFDGVCREIISTPSMQLSSSDPGKSREERLRSAAEDLQIASRRLAMTAHLKNSVDRAWSEADALVEHWKNVTLALAATPSQNDGHTLGTAARVLKAAGLTCPISRSITESQLKRIGAILKEQAIDDAPAPLTGIVACPVNVDWTTDNAWVSMPREIPGYTTKERLATPHEQGLAAIIELGLPPFADLTKFGLATEFATFLSADTNDAKRCKCWALLKQWLTMNKVAGLNGPVSQKMREQAWVFMFAVKYGFTQDVVEFRKVRFPSPWQRNAVIEAERA